MIMRVSGKRMRTNMTSNRSTDQIYADVLSIIDESDRHGVATTALCHKANISHGRLKKLILNLTSSGMMDRKFDTAGKHTFVITENGKVYLEQYKRLSELAEDFGLEL